MTVDGPKNTVVEIDSVPSAPGPDNPHGNAWETRRTVLANEAEARRDIDTGRRAVLEDRERRAEVGAGRADAYALMPGSTVPPMYSPDALYAQRSGFTEHQLWVTAYDPSSGSRRATTPTSSRSARACRPTATATGRSRAPTSWSGTRSAPTTWCVRRTGR